MWRNLRGVGSAMSAIENIVAPVDGEDDDSEEDYEDDEYSEEEEDGQDDEPDQAPLHQRFAATAKSAVQSSPFTSLVSNVIQAATAGSDSEEEDNSEEEDFTEEEGTDGPLAPQILDQRMAQQQLAAGEPQSTTTALASKATDSQIKHIEKSHNGDINDDWEEEAWNQSHRAQEDPVQLHETTATSPATPNRGLLKRESGSITPLQLAAAKVVPFNSTSANDREGKTSEGSSSAIMPPPLKQPDDIVNPLVPQPTVPLERKKKNANKPDQQLPHSLSGSNHRHPRPPSATKSSPSVSKRISAETGSTSSARATNPITQTDGLPAPLPATRSPTPPHISASAANRPKPPPPSLPGAPKPKSFARGTSNGSTDASRQQDDYQQECIKLQTQLQQAEQHILELQQAQRMSLEKEEAAQALFAQKEARILAAAAEEHAQEMQKLQEQYESQLQMARQETENEQQHDSQLTLLLEQAERNLQTTEKAHQKEIVRLQKEHAQNIQRHERSTRVAQDQLATAQAKLDQATEQTTLLQEQVRELKSHVQDHARDSQEAEEEVEELHTENEQLETALAKQEHETSKWKNKAQDLRAEVDSLRGLKVRHQNKKEEPARNWFPHDAFFLFVFLLRIIRWSYKC